MEKTVIELTKLTASKGMVLTNGEAYGKEIYLGCNDKPENWREITDAEYDEIRRAVEEEVLS
ncbi:MAG: hypothetical protein J6Q10_02160 [Clostridia bacterium]|nr:hypothetical protein [Clostridia bacterium]